MARVSARQCNRNAKSFRKPGKMQIDLFRCLSNLYKIALLNIDKIYGLYKYVIVQMCQILHTMPCIQYKRVKIFTVIVYKQKVLLKFKNIYIFK